MTVNYSDEFEYDVALSFAGEDRPIVEKFAKLMDTKHINYFYDDAEAFDLWGKDLIAHLAEIYEKKARYCIMFISEHYPRKLWTNFERLHIQARAFRDPNEYILPIKLDDTEVPGLVETTGYRDIRKHSLESIANSLEKKLAKAKGQSTKSRALQKAISNRRQPTSSAFGSIPMPHRDKTFSELQKDQFAKEAFSVIKKYFQQALKQLKAQDPEIETVLDKINNWEFRSKIYVKETVKCECRICWETETRFSIAEKKAGLKGILTTNPLLWRITKRNCD